MYRGAGTPLPHRSTATDITTINYTLDWPYLEHNSNTTFAGITQIDICRCPQGSPSFPIIRANEPGHIYTRYKCNPPEVTFKGPEEKLWCLQYPHGPINMLRPSTEDEDRLRKEISDDCDPSAYADRNLLFLTGPCPRGRYQAYATLQYLKSLSKEARQHVSHLSLISQPMEEDSVDAATAQSYSELALYIVQHLPAFNTLCLNIWDDEGKLRNMASEFSVLLHRDGVKIVVSWSWWEGEIQEYASARGFLEALSTEGNIKPRTWKWATGQKTRTVDGDEKGEEQDDREHASAAEDNGSGQDEESDCEDEDDGNVWEDDDEDDEDADHEKQEEGVPPRIEDEGTVEGVTEMNTTAPSTTEAPTKISTITSSSHPYPAPSSPDLPPISPTSPTPQVLPPHSRTSSSATAIYRSTDQPDESPTSEPDSVGEKEVDADNDNATKEKRSDLPDSAAGKKLDPSQKEGNEIDEGKGKGKDSDGDEDSDEWVDATLGPNAISPRSAKEDGSWQVI